MNEVSSVRRDRSSDLSIAQLHTFRLVIRHGGYAAAARASDLSVPSVWQHVQALERLYGTKLFTRVGRMVQPTEAAQRLYEQVDTILVQLESTFDAVQATSAKAPVRVVAGVRMMMEDLAEPLATFRRTHSNPLTIQQGNERVAEELLLADKADIS